MNNLNNLNNLTKILFFSFLFSISLHSYRLKYSNNQDLEHAGIKQLEEANEFLENYTQQLKEAYKLLGISPGGMITRNRFKKLPKELRFLFKLDMYRMNVMDQYSKEVSNSGEESFDVDADGVINSFYIRRLKDRVEEEICEFYLSEQNEVSSEEFENHLVAVLNNPRRKIYQDVLCDLYDEESNYFDDGFDGEFSEETLSSETFNFEELDTPEEMVTTINVESPVNRLDRKESSEKASGSSQDRTKRPDIENLAPRSVRRRFSTLPFSEELKKGSVLEKGVNRVLRWVRRK